MRVTFVCAGLNLSGGSRVIATYARMLAADGHQVCVVAPAPQPITLRRRLRTLLREGEWLRRPRGSHFDRLGLDVRQLDHAPIIDADVPDADIVIATWWETAEWVNALSASKGRKVYLVQGHEVFDTARADRVRATYRMPMRKIVVSGWLKAIMEQTYDQHDCVLVPNAFDRDVFHAEPRDKNAVPTVGFMHARGDEGRVKGVDVAIEAVARLKQTLPSLRVLSFGKLPARDLGPDVQFHCSPPQNELRATYAACDVWLCTSRSEGFGLPALEAMACRTPVVATPVGWLLDAIDDGVNGYRVPMDDAQAAADAALKCLRLDAAAWKAVSEGAYRTAMSCSWDRSYALFAAALKSAPAP